MAVRPTYRSQLYKSKTEKDTTTRKNLRKHTTKRLLKHGHGYRMPRDQRRSAAPRRSQETCGGGASGTATNASTRISKHGSASSQRKLQLAAPSTAILTRNGYSNSQLQARQR